ncbi:MAG: DUF4388 domain-containing protein [Acidobacteriota bacterium]
MNHERGLVARILMGSLGAVPLPDVLTFLNLLKKTGTLTIEGAGSKKRVFFERGEIIFAASEDPNERLDTFLIQRGKITPEQSAEAGRRMLSGMRFGRILVAMGLLTPSELWTAVQSQVLEVVYSLFPSKDGMFFFDETPEPYEEKIRLSSSFTNIMMEGVRRLDEWPRIREVIPDDEAVPRRCPVDNRDRSVDLTDTERRVYELADGRRSVRQIIHGGRLGDFEGRRALVTLIIARHIYIPEKQPTRWIGPADDSAAINDRIRLFNELSSLIAAALKKRLPPERVVHLMQGALGCVAVPQLAGVTFDSTGKVDPRVIFSNVSEHPAESRRTVVSSALYSLLTALVDASDRHLDAHERRALAEVVSKLAPQLQDMA